MSFGEARRQARRFREFVKRFVEAFLPAQNGSENEMQERIVGIFTQHGADLVFGGSEILVMNQGSDLGCRTRAGA